MPLDETPQGELPEIEPSTLVDDEQVDPEELDTLEEISPAELEAFETAEPEPAPEADEPIALVEEEVGEHEQKIKAIGKALEIVETDFKRSMNVTGTGATRCKIFHSKIAVGPMEYMQKSINDWVDSGDIEIKDVTQVVGIMEGKRPEPNLIVTIWY